MDFSRTDRVDTLIVGSGINSLVCAALLARGGRKVRVLEREATLGGCLRTDELTLPGFLHDTLATAHSLFLAGAAHEALGGELREAGLEYLHTTLPAGVLLPDGRHLTLSTSGERNVIRLNEEHPGDGSAYAAALERISEQAPLVFSQLGNELWRFGNAGTLSSASGGGGEVAMSQPAREVLPTARAWLAESFGSELVGALLAPWALHWGSGPDAPMSALMTKVAALTFQSVGMPIARGGNINFVRAFQQVITRYGGEFEVNADVAQVLVENGRAVGVRLADGREHRAAEVVCNMTPTQLYGRLLSTETIPPEVKAQGLQWRHGRASMQIHLALSEAPEWSTEELARVGQLHLTAGADAVSRAVNEAELGYLPADPTLSIAQPTTIDPSRAPPGQHILWIQMPECPSVPLGDAAGKVHIPAGFGWTIAAQNALADRAIENITRHAPNLRRAILARRVLAPPDLERLNMNLVGGDPYGGDCGREQSTLWRPLRALRTHETPIARLWHIGASTHPGPGLGGGSGFQLARTLGAV